MFATDASCVSGRPCAGTGHHVIAGTYAPAHGMIEFVRRWWKCYADRHGYLFLQDDDMVDVAGGECGVAASPLRAVGPTAFDDDPLSAPTAVSPDAKRSRLDGEGAGRPASSSMTNSTVQLSGLPSTASVLEGVPEAWRNNFVGFVDSTPPKASFVDSRGRCMRVKPSTTPLPSEPVKTGKGRGC